MNNPIRALKHAFSPGQRDAIRLFLAERRIARSHRAGLRKIRKESLSRPHKLNLGCGPHPKPGFVNVDLFCGDVTLDLRRGLPFETNCCEMIFSEHCFEHFDYPEPISFIFRECLRVLRPGGLLRLAVPHTEEILRAYVEGDRAEYWGLAEKLGYHPRCTTLGEKVNYHFRQDGEHRYAYDWPTMEKLLRSVEFGDVRCAQFDQAIDSKHRHIGDLCVEAKKRVG